MVSQAKDGSDGSGSRAPIKRISANGIEPNAHWPEHRDDPDEGQVALCREWIRTFGRRRKNLDRQRSSYGLKHRVEEWSRSLPESDPRHSMYVSNGAFIAACVREGYRAERSDKGSLNALFDMDTESALRAMKAEQKLTAREIARQFKEESAARCAEARAAIREANRRLRASLGSSSARAISPKLRAMVLERDEFRCRRCRSREELVVDHILPVARGGTNAIGNLQALCVLCNQGKAARMPHPAEIRNDV